MIVQGLNTILKIQNGSVYEAIACNASCALQITTDYLETTFLDSGADRGFIPNKHTKTLQGSGPIVLGRDVTIIDVVQLQLTRTMVSWQFELSDTLTTFTYSGQGFFTSCNITGAVGQAATCDYSLLVNGAITVTSDAGESSGECPLVMRFTAVGGETSVGDAGLIGVDKLLIFKNGIEIIDSYPSAPAWDEVSFDPATGVITIGTALLATERIEILYNP